MPAAASRLLVLFSFATLATSAVVTAQSAETFARTADMTAARSLHSATLLSDGQVLIAGGAAGDTLASVELYDPGTGRFRAVGPMTTARRMHSATLLADDRVLIVGGYRDGDALASAELYDPVTATFSAAASLGHARGGHTAILLPTGEVLVIGGYGTRAYPNLAPAEIYDPASGAFRAAGAYVGRGGCDFCAPAVLLHDGTVLFAGQSPAQLYDPVRDSFSPGGTAAFELSAAAALINGQVLFAGGESMGRLAYSELYDAAARTFVRTSDMTSRRVWHTLTSLPNGLALAAGGETDSCSGNSCFFAGSVASAELYDASTRSFVPAGSMGVARSTHTATLLGDGRVLVAGGVSYGGIGIFHGSLASAEIYTPAVQIPAPALVSLSGDGRGRGAIFHAGTTDAVTPEDPAAADESVDIYCTGLPEGSVIVPRIVIGGRLAAVSFIARAADMPGATVLRVRVPHGIAAAPAVAVRLIHMDRPSNAVTLAVR